MCIRDSDVSHVECRQRLGDYRSKSVVDGECRYVWYDLCDPGQVEGPSHVHISEIRSQRRSATSSFDISCHGSVAPSGRMSVTWLVSVPTVSYTHLRAHETVLDLVC